MDSLYDLLCLNGNQKVLIQVDHNNLITSYGLFVEIQSLTTNYKDEFIQYMKELTRIVTSELSKIKKLMNEKNDEDAKYLRTLTYRANETTFEQIGNRLEIRQLGFATSKMLKDDFDLKCENELFHHLISF